MDLADRYIREGFGIDEALDELDTVLGDFGASITKEVDNYLKDVMELEEEWANEVQYWWKETAPYNSKNLKDSVSIENDKFPAEITVGVDVEKLLRRAGEKVPAVRTGGSVVIPDYDYTEDADEVNVSAKREPYGVEEHIPFINEVWYAYAQRLKQEVFD